MWDVAPEGVRVAEKAPVEEGVVLSTSVILLDTDELAEALPSLDTVDEAECVRVAVGSVDKDPLLLQASVGVDDFVCSSVNELELVADGKKENDHERDVDTNDENVLDADRSSVNVATVFENDHDPDRDADALLV
jgi:hypothetical protein